MSVSGLCVCVSVSGVHKGLIVDDDDGDDDTVTPHIRELSNSKTKQMLRCMNNLNYSKSLHIILALCV